MDSIQLSLVLLAAFWAGTSAVWSGIGIMISARDKIMMGYIADHKLTVDQRRKLLIMDWLPVRMSLGAVSIFLAFLILYLPELSGSQQLDPEFSTVTYGAAIVPFCGAVYFAIGGVLEYRYLVRSLNKE